MLNDPYSSFADEVTISDPLAAQLMRQLMDQGTPMDEHARRLLAPAAACLFEWQEYKLELPGADRLRVGTRSVWPFSAEHGFPRCGPVPVEVISTKIRGYREPHAQQDAFHHAVQAAKHKENEFRTLLHQAFNGECPHVVLDLLR